MRRALLAEARKGTELAEIWLSASNGKLVAEIYRQAKVLGQRTEDGQVVLNVRMDKGVAVRLKRAGVNVSLDPSS